MKAWIYAVSLMLVTAGCSGGDDDGDGSPSPSEAPSASPTDLASPTGQPATPRPTDVPPTDEPSQGTTDAPTPTLAPTDEPTAEVSEVPTDAATEPATVEPTDEVTAEVSEAPTDEAPTEEPTAAPTSGPTAAPTSEPTAAPTAEPTDGASPTLAPTEEPTATEAPTEAATAGPTDGPSPTLPPGTDTPGDTPTPDVTPTPTTPTPDATPTPATPTPTTPTPGTPTVPPAPDDTRMLIFSEYIEGSSNNKAFELTNLTNNEVSLDGWEIWIVNNGGSFSAPENKIVLSGVVAARDVVVFAHASANSAIQAEKDITFPTVFSYNGDDALALVHGTKIIDVIGVDTTVPPTGGWDVAGVAKATLDHTLVRKALIVKGNTNWALSAGTTPEDSEWIVLDKDNSANLGKVTEPPPPARKQR